MWFYSYLLAVKPIGYTHNFQYFFAIYQRAVVHARKTRIESRSFQLEIDLESVNLTAMMCPANLLHETFFTDRFTRIKVNQWCIHSHVTRSFSRNSNHFDVKISILVLLNNKRGLEGVLSINYIYQETNWENSATATKKGEYNEKSWRCQ